MLLEKENPVNDLPCFLYRVICCREGTTTELGTTEPRTTKLGKTKPRTTKLGTTKPGTSEPRKNHTVNMANFAITKPGTCYTL
jgi:hypothetical protein